MPGFTALGEENVAAWPIELLSGLGGLHGGLLWGCELFFVLNLGYLLFQTGPTGYI